MGRKAKQRNTLAKKLINRLRRRHKVLAAFLPLKIGIHKEIWRRHKKLIRELAQEVPGVTEATLNDEARELLAVALINHTRHVNYIKNMLRKKRRFTLDGEEAEEITDKDREVYRQRLEALAQREPKKKPKPAPKAGRSKAVKIIKKRRIVKKGEADG